MPDVPIFLQTKQISHLPDVAVGNTDTGCLLHLKEKSSSFPFLVSSVFVLEAALREDGVLRGEAAVSAGAGAPGQVPGPGAPAHHRLPEPRVVRLGHRRQSGGHAAALNLQWKHRVETHRESGVYSSSSHEIFLCTVLQI